MFLEYTKTVLKDLVLPPAGPVLLAIIGACCLRWRPRLGRALLALGLASLWLLSTPLIANHLARAAERYPALDASHLPSAQAIVILGGGGERTYAAEYGGPAAEPELLARLAYGAYLARSSGLPILVTGYHIEATAMRDTLKRNFAIEPRWNDNQAYDTFENARNSARLLRAAGVQRILLVTSATHEWRAAHEFAAAGIQVVPAPVGVVPRRDPSGFRYLPDMPALNRSSEALYELLGEQVRKFLAATHLRRQPRTP